MVPEPNSLNQTARNQTPPNQTARNNQTAGTTNRRSRNMSKTETKIRITDVRTVGVPVTQQDRALEFYVDRLGFEKRLDVPMGHGARWIEVAPPGARTTIALIPEHDGVPAGGGRGG